MALVSRFFSYQKLKHEDDDEVGNREYGRVITDFVRRKIRWSRLRKARMKMKRVKIRIPWLLRRKASLGVKCSWDRVLKRLKESQSHFGDIFGGNYLFVQVNPTPYKLNPPQPQSSPSFSY